MKRPSSRLKRPSSRLRKLAASLDAPGYPWYVWALDTCAGYLARWGW